MDDETAASPPKAVSSEVLDRPRAVNVAFSDVGEGHNWLCLEIPAGTRISRRVRGAGIPGRSSPPEVAKQPAACIATDRWEDDGGAGEPTNGAGGHPIEKLNSRSPLSQGHANDV